MEYHTLPTQTVWKMFGTHRQKGLSAVRAGELLERRGRGELPGRSQRGLFQKFLYYLTDYAAVVLLAAAVGFFVSALTGGGGGVLEAAILLAAVSFNAALGVWVDEREEKAGGAAENLPAPSAKVVRDGAVRTVCARAVVPGDLLVLEAGDRIPADGRLVEGEGLLCGESALTGESATVEKDPAARIPANAPLGKRVNMVYAGCSVTGGRGLALVTATGAGTEWGAKTLSNGSASQEQTPFQTHTARLGRLLGIAAAAVCATAFLIGLLRGMEGTRLFRSVLPLAVAAVPQGLPAAVTAALVLGVRRMGEKGAALRRLSSVEILGGVSVICTGITGSLTEDWMKVVKVWPCGGEMEDAGGGLTEDARQVLRLGALCSGGTAERGEEGELLFRGSPADTAIVEAARRARIEREQLEEEFPKLGEIPASSGRNRMATLHRAGDGALVVVKGAVDALLPRCGAPCREEAEEVHRAMGKRAMRVLAVACRRLAELPQPLEGGELERGLTLVGLIGMENPLREESADAVKLCARAGIRTVIVTGEHADAACTAAKELGILRDGGRIVSGRELEDMSREKLETEAERVSVYARMSSRDKIRVARAWRSRGSLVCLTENGGNTPPSLEAADIVCAGNACARDAPDTADLVLADGSFSSAAEAARLSRGIMENIHRIFRYLLGSSLGEILCILAALLCFGELPLTAVHLLLVNVLINAPPALSLGVEPVGAGAARRLPALQSRGGLSRRVWMPILLQGAMAGTLTFTAYWIGRAAQVSWHIPPGVEAGRTMAFLVLALSQVVHAWNCRTEKSLFDIGFATNKTMLQGGLLSVLTLLACLSPPLKAVFRLGNLSVYHWLIAVGLSLAPIAIVEAGKAVARLWALL